MNGDIASWRDLQSAIVRGETDWKQFGDVNVIEKSGLLLFNYTDRAQYTGRWNWFERVSRGLVMDAGTGDIVALPFEKFFNWGEGGRTSSGGIREITEKMDGSLGIVFNHRGEWRVVTRGNFDSDQALWATDRLSGYNMDAVSPDKTLLVEIVYPDNRVIVDYGVYEALVLIGVRGRNDHSDQWWNTFAFGAAKQCGMDVPGRFYSMHDIDGIVQKCERETINREGFVVRFDDGQRFKFKGSAYRRIARLLAMTTLKNVLAAHQDGSIDEWLCAVPPVLSGELLAYIHEVEATIAATHERIYDLFGMSPKRAGRKEFAEWAKRYPDDMPYLFMLYDGKPIRDMIYKLAFRDTVNDERTER